MNYPKDKEELAKLISSSTVKICTTLFEYTLNDDAKNIIVAALRDRSFDAAFNALQRLNAGRSVWNGQIHQAAAILREATEPNSKEPA